MVIFFLKISKKKKKERCEMGLRTGYRPYLFVSGGSKNT
jgi:hypothetical protein